MQVSLIHLFQNISSILEHIKLLDLSLWLNTILFEYLVQLISAGWKADSTENVLLVLDIGTWHSRFLALGTNLAHRHVSFWSTHWRERHKFTLQNWVAIQIASFDCRSELETMESMLSGGHRNLVDLLGIWHWVLVLQTSLRGFFWKYVLRILTTLFSKWAINHTTTFSFSPWGLDDILLCSIRSLGEEVTLRRGILGCRHPLMTGCRRVLCSEPNWCLRLNTSLVHFQSIGLGRLGWIFGILMQGLLGSSKIDFRLLTDRLNRDWNACSLLRLAVRVCCWRLHELELVILWCRAAESLLGVRVQVLDETLFGLHRFD